MQDLSQIHCIQEAAEMLAATEEHIAFNTHCQIDDTIAESHFSQVFTYSPTL